MGWLMSGLELAFPTLADFVLAGVPNSDAGSASRVLNTVMQVGGAVDVAVIAVIFFELLARQGVPANPAEQGDAFAFSFQWALVCAIGLFALAAVLPRLLTRLLPASLVSHTAATQQPRSRAPSPLQSSPKPMGLRSSTTGLPSTWYLFYPGAILLTVVQFL